MIPATYPSILDSSNRTKMLVYQVPSITGLTRWVDYIPVKSPASESDLTLANTFANEGFILTSKVNDITGLVPFKDYVPIYLDSTATKAWSADNDGYIPMAELAGLLLDFTTGALDPRIDFTRATNATVTRADGTIGFAPHNLLTFSEQFDNAAWVKAGTTISANSVIAPNGTITSDKIIEDTSTGSHTVRQNITVVVGTTYTYSFYVKEAGRSNILVFDVNDSTFCYINLSTKSVTAGTLIPTITDVGSGWLRISTTSTATSTTSRNWVYLVQSGTTISYTGDGTSGVYLWGAQLEIGSTATTYNPTTVKNLLGYSELFDNAAWTKSNSFVQTNSLTFSEAFDNAAWGKTRSNITGNAEIAPNGYQTADKFYLDNSAATTHSITQSFAFSAGQYTYSVYVKPAGLNYINLYSFAVTAGCYFNVSNGTVIGAGAGITGAITPAANGYYRCSITFTSTASTFGNTLFLSANGTDIIPNGDGVSGVYIWGAQLVQGSVAGDYRRTDAAALPVYYPNHNGVVCAEKWVEGKSTFSKLAINTASGTQTGKYTTSIYAKKGERTQIAIGMSDNTIGETYVIADLSTGTVASPVSAASWTGATASISLIANDWYRISLTAFKSTASTNITGIAYIVNGGTITYTGDGTSGIYIFGAQLSDSASLDPYVLNAGAAPTAAAYYGARFDYDPVTLAPKGLLIEEQRTNTLTYSEDYTQAVWTKGGSTISANAVNAPSGTQTADKIVEDTTNAPHYIFYSGTLASATYTFSVYIKQAGRTWVKLALGQTTQGTAYFNLSTGVVGTVTSGYTTSITPVGNDWYRCTISGTGAGTVYQCVVYAATADGVDSYAGDITKGIYAWGAQLEAGAFATSYIPTAASQVTRAADIATIQGSNFYSWYNQDVGTFYANVSTTLASAPTIILASDATAANIINIGKENSTQSSFFVRNNNITQANLIQTGLLKLCGAYAINNSAFTADNGTVLTDTSFLPPYVNQIWLGRYIGSIGFYNSTIKSISYSPQRLSDSVLKGLTA